MKRKKIRRKIKPEFSSLVRNDTEPETKLLIEYWLSKKGLRKSRPNSGVYLDTVSFLNKKIKKYKTERGKEQFFTRAINSIKIYQKLLAEGKVKKVSIKVFFIPPNRRYSKRLNYFQLISGGKIEQHILREGTVKQRKFVAERIKNLYCRHVLNKDPKTSQFDRKQLMGFFIAARRLLNFMYNNKELDFIKSDSTSHIDNFIRTMISSIKWHYKRKRFYIGMLASEHTFNEVLPKYINLRVKRN